MLSLFPQCAALSKAIAKHRHLASFQALEGISPWCTAAKGCESPINPLSELPALCRCFYTLRYLIQHHMPMSGHTELCPTSTFWWMARLSGPHWLSCLKVGFSILSYSMLCVIWTPYCLIGQVAWRPSRCPGRLKMALHLDHLFPLTLMEYKQAYIQMPVFIYWRLGAYNLEMNCQMVSKIALPKHRHLLSF